MFGLHKKQWRRFQDKPGDVAWPHPGSFWEQQGALGSNNGNRASGHQWRPLGSAQGFGISPEMKSGVAQGSSQDQHRDLGPAQGCCELSLGPDESEDLSSEQTVPALCVPLIIFPLVGITFWGRAPLEFSGRIRPFSPALFP